MSAERWLIFICDRCGDEKREQLDLRPSWQPIGWAKASWVQPPLASPNDTANATILCSRCFAQLKRFLERLPQSVPATEAVKR